MRNLYDPDQPLKRTSVCKEIIDDQHMVIRRQKFLRHNDMILTFMCERFNLANRLSNSAPI